MQDSPVSTADEPAAVDLAFDPAADALFLDFDGTLVELADRPENVSVAGHLPGLLERVFERMGGAVAVITGRPLKEVDGFLAPVRLPGAGSHGAELRYTAEADLTLAQDAHRLEDAREAIAEFASRHDLLNEWKTGAVTLHYRSDPSMRDDALALVRELAEGEDAFRVIDGDMVVELALATVTKGTALERLMSHAPFSGRRPLAFGDDVTDEDAFAAALSAGGTAVKVGPKATRAPHRMPDVATVHAWLARAAGLAE